MASSIIIIPMRLGIRSMMYMWCTRKIAQASLEQEKIHFDCFHCCFHCFVLVCHVLSHFSRLFVYTLIEIKSSECSFPSPLSLLPLNPHMLRLPDRLQWPLAIALSQPKSEPKSQSSHSAPAAVRLSVASSWTPPYSPFVLLLCVPDHLSACVTSAVAARVTEISMGRCVMVTWAWKSLHERKSTWTRGMSFALEYLYLCSRSIYWPFSFQTRT